MIDNQQHTQEKVQNVVLFKKAYKELVQILVPMRKQSGATIDDLSVMLKVDRRKIISFENLKKIDLEILLLYCDKYSIDLNLNHQTN